MNVKKIIQRFLCPSFIVSVYYYFKFKCYISLKAEVELSSNLVIGRGTQISSFTKIKASDGLLTIGSEVSIATNSFIASHAGGIEIGDYCLISPNVSIVAVNYSYDKINVPICEQEQISKGIKIGNNVWIGSGAVILDGVRIEEGVIITPNSVVSSHVPRNSIVQGNPAKIIFTRR